MAFSRKTDESGGIAGDNHERVGIGNHGEYSRKWLKSARGVYVCGISASEKRASERDCVFETIRIELLSRTVLEQYFSPND